MNQELQEKIEVVESGYEFLLAYAAQGRESDGGPDSEVRTALAGMAESIGDITRILAAGGLDFAWVVEEDARKATAAIELVQRQQEISSELVDNLNVSIHLRALLADLFLVGEVGVRGDSA